LCWRTLLGRSPALQSIRRACVRQTASRQAYGRNCLEVGGVWIDEGFEGKMKMVQIKAQSDAYFKILDRQPQMKDVFRLGNHLVWVAPSGQALVIDASNGEEKLTDEQIDKLFTPEK